jgi:hypothetical protein
MWKDFTKAVQSSDLPKFVREQAVRVMQREPTMET